MGRKSCCSKEEIKSLNRGAWAAEEDKILTDYIKIYGEGNWRCLPKRAGLKRCGKSCRLRWLNYLRPDIKRGNISPDEEDLIIRLHNLLGNRWSLIAGRLPGRTDNEIKNYWNTNIRKKRKLQDEAVPSSTEKIICQENPKPAGDKKSLLAETGTCPIRTRASKCTKVFFAAPEQEPYDDQAQVNNHTKQTMVANGFVVDQNYVKGAGLSVPEFNLEENDPFDFMIDFEMDNHFSNFLDSAFLQSPPPSLDDNTIIGVDISTTTTTTKTSDGDYFPSLNPDETAPLLSDNNLHYF